MMNENEHAELLALYKESFPMAARLVHKLGGGLEEARDVFHDALIVYLEKKQKGELHIHTSAVGYIVGITRLLWIKKQKKQHHSLLLDENLEQSLAEKEVYPSEKERSVLEYLQMAGQKCVQLLKAFYYENKSMEEIAQCFGYRGSRSATVQKYKCLEKIKATLKSTAHAERVS